ncbi:MAG: hypothetical protein GXP53_00905 [Deltaproteobacteria bacterium]|nr:hypothetical protein [Deltaproteobacteria bacterium]
MRKLIITTITMVFCATLLAQPALAGSKQRHIWKGVAIGAGAVLLGQAIFHDRAAERYPSRVTVIERPVYRAPAPVYRSGYWKVRKTWVSAEYKTVWNPGHYNAYEQWVPGHRIRIETRPGFWQKDRVWVACR